MVYSFVIWIFHPIKNWVMEEIGYENAYIPELWTVAVIVKCMHFNKQTIKQHWQRLIKCLSLCWNNMYNYKSDWEQFNRAKKKKWRLIFIDIPMFISAHFSTTFDSTAGLLYTKALNGYVDFQKNSKVNRYIELCNPIHRIANTFSLIINSFP